MTTPRSLHARLLRAPRRRWVIAGLAAVGSLVGPATAMAAVCYTLPFPNPTLSDGWGSLCCGRTSPHRGVDFPQASGTPVPAVADGTVVVNTYSGCLGNVVVLAHADGMYSGYSHLVAASPLAKGTVVAQGESVGKVGNTGTCSQGAHLHLTMSPSEGGWASGTTVDPYKYIQSHLTCNIDAKGSLMSVDCEQIFGWAQDPDTPEQDISTRLFFDGPSSDPDAAHDTVVADIEHGALCEVIDSCDHGFTMPAPYSLFDGLDHEVHAYGIDSGTNEKIELGGSPKTLGCLPALDGLRRTIADPEVLAAWKFSTFVDTVTIDDAKLAALGQTFALPSAPMLARADDGSEGLWLIDGPAHDLRRAVPDAAISGWRLDVATALELPAAELLALAEAPPLRARPLLVKGSGPELFVLDADLDPPQSGESSSGDSGASSGDGGEGGGSGEGDTGSTGAPPPTTGAATSSGSSGEGGPGLPEGFGADAGCGCRSGGAPGAWLGALVLVSIVPRRRRP